jgi:hypothetical protein
MDPTSSDFQCRPGDEVHSLDDSKMGKVIAVDTKFLTVERGLLSKTQYFVPLSAVDACTDKKVYLKMSKDQVEQAGWNVRPVMTAGETTAGAAAGAPAAGGASASASAAPAPSVWATTSAPAAALTPPAAPAPSAGAAPAAEPSVNDLRPMLKPGVENEPMLLLDITGSMSYPVAAGSTVQRREVIGEAIGRIVEQLAAQDSQAAKEQAEGKDAGGLMTVTFAGGSATCIDDLSPANWRQKWGALPWGGGTWIMPGWNLLVDTYMEEFGEVSKLDRPHLLGLIITDGEAQDTAEFAQMLAQAKGGTYVCVAILGFGPEHDQALAAYRQIAAANDHVRVVTFGSETDPTTIADGLLSLLGQAA